jgi:predicted secreted protein
MKDELMFDASLCGEYEKLLSDCQRALDQWNARSEQVRQTQQIGEGTGRELLRLQARFAKAYTVLQRHVERCERCQLASRMSTHIVQANTETLAEAN